MIAQFALPNLEQTLHKLLLHNYYKTKINRIFKLVQNQFESNFRMLIFITFILPMVLIIDGN